MPAATIAMRSSCSWKSGNPRAREDRLERRDADSDVLHTLPPLRVGIRRTDNGPARVRRD